MPKNTKTKFNVSEFEEMKKVAFDAAIGAGKILEKHYLTDLKQKEKERGDFVTVADLMSEKLIVSTIKKKFPKARIHSEEAGNIGIKNEKQLHNNEYTWVIDPLDGTNNFRYGIPNFFVIIGIMKQGEVLFVIDYQPITKQLYWAEKGKGAFVGNKRIYVSKTSSLKNTFASIGIWRAAKNSKKMMGLYNHTYFKIRKAIQTGCIGFSASAIASGRLDANLINSSSLHDCYILQLLVKEAGGKVTSLDNKELSVEIKEDTLIIYSNSKIHSELLKHIKTHF